MENVQKVLNDIKIASDSLNSKINELFEHLISDAKGKSIQEIRILTLEFIKKNQVPDEIANKIKRKIDKYINDVEIK